MPFIPTTVNDGDVVSSAWGNDVQQQYAQVKNELMNIEGGDIKILIKNVLATSSCEFDSYDTTMIATSKKADALTFEGQCSYGNASSSVAVVVAEAVSNNLRFGAMVFGARMKISNNAVSGTPVRMVVYKNVSGTWTAVATRTIAPSEFTTTTDYYHFFLPFDYTGAKALNNQIKLSVDLQTSATTFELDVDFFQVLPVTVGTLI